jgi:hypothetical protein
VFEKAKLKGPKRDSSAVAVDELCSQIHPQVQECQDALMLGRGRRTYRPDPGHQLTRDSLGIVDGLIAVDTGVDIPRTMLLGPRQQHDGQLTTVSYARRP